MNVFSDLPMFTYTAYGNKNLPLFFHHSVSHSEDGGAYVMPDVHLNYEILLLLKGKLKYNVEGISYVISPGDVILIDSNEMHTVELDLNEDYERMVIQFNKNIIPHAYEMFQEMLVPFFYDKNKNRIIPDRIVSKYKVKEILYNIKSACDSGSKYIPSLIASCVHELLIELNLIRDSAILEDKNALPPHTVNIFMQNVFKYIEENISTKFTVDDMAKALFVSTSYLAHQFKKTMGMPIKKYINFKKATNAINYMSMGMRAKEACEKMGYNYYSTFFYNYKKLNDSAQPDKED